MSEVIQCEYSVEGEGPALFLIHGIGAARDGWRFMISELKNEFTCITYDLRGHGLSPLPASEFGLDDLVNDLEALRERLGVEQAHFAGHSLGGMIGPAYARKYPERVLSLGLLSTAAGRSDGDRNKLDGVYKMLTTEGIPATLQVLVDRWFTESFAADNPELVQRRIDQVVETDADIFLNVFRIYAGTEMAPWLKEVNIPSLVLTGENDGGCNPRLNEFIVSELPDAELVILPGFRHSILVEAPNQTAAAMKDFIQRRAS